MRKQVEIKERENYIHTPDFFFELHTALLFFFYSKINPSIFDNITLSLYITVTSITRKIIVNIKQ